MLINTEIQTCKSEIFKEGLLNDLAETLYSLVKISCLAQNFSAEALTREVKIVE
jgi:hypothetical protein